MIARVFKRTLISWFAAFAILFLAAIIWARPLIAIAYLTVGHRVAISLRQQWLAHGLNAATVAADLRQFARDQRLTRPEKVNTPYDFFYHDDSRFPVRVRLLQPSWVQISDDRIDVGCGEIGHDGAYAFGLRVWRDQNAPGYGTKKLGEGMWYYQQEYEYP